MNRHAQARLRIGAALLVVLPLILIPVTAASTDAAWTDSENGTGSFAAGTVAPVTAMTCTAGLLQPVTFNWTAPSGGLVRTGYRWTVTGGIAGSGVAPAAATTLTLTNGLLGIGSGTFTLYAVGPGGWESLPKTGSLGFATVVVNVLSSCSVP